MKKVRPLANRDLVEWLVSINVRGSIRVSLFMFQSSRAGTSQAFFDPLETMTTPAGYLAPAAFQSKNKEDVARLKSLATKILHDPLLMRELGDRVYELMLDDMRLQRERSRHYGGGL